MTDAYENAYTDITKYGDTESRTLDFKTLPAPFWSHGDLREQSCVEYRPGEELFVCNSAGQKVAQISSRSIRDSADDVTRGSIEFVIPESGPSYLRPSKRSYMYPPFPGGTTSPPAIPGRDDYPLIRGDVDAALDKYQSNIRLKNITFDGKVYPDARILMGGDHLAEAIGLPLNDDPTISDDEIAMSLIDDAR